ncbi:uncharacterized protein LOC124256314 [Haliotis rubra]|uniref:uncharacterized protein LOC124256314 n=1 Tax=Haliotis rubra TaxID=36100 RepID=UPI001EE5C0C4|nr:uncharacterized protein LOC124256314 [Haliotis rubra]
MSPHPGKANFNLGFSLEIDATFSSDLNEKTSPAYLNYSAAFKEKISLAFLGVPGFRYIIINEFRSGSIICDYTAVINATANSTEVIAKIGGPVKQRLQQVDVNGIQINSGYLNRKFIEDLRTSKKLMSSRCNAEGICDFGYSCSDEKANQKVICTSNCNGNVCGDHGVCHLQADGQPTCRCKTHPKYVYSGDKCEITGEQLLLKSEYIAAIAGGAGGGLVLILVIALICTCVRKRKAQEKRDGGNVEGIQQQWTSIQDDSKGYHLQRQSYEAIEMDQLPTERIKPSLDEEPFSMYQPSMREDHYRTGAEKSFDSNRLSRAVSGFYANVNERRRKTISVIQNTPHMQIQNSKLDLREQYSFRSHDQMGQDGYVPKDRHLERLYREQLMSDRNHGRHESFRNDRRSLREADRVQQTPVLSPKPRPKTFGEFRHPNSFIPVPEPDYGVDNGSGMEHNRRRPRQDNEPWDRGQLYRSESQGRVNDSAFARDLQRRGQEIRCQGQIEGNQGQTWTMGALGPPE